MKELENARKELDKSRQKMLDLEQAVLLDRDRMNKKQSKTIQVLVRLLKERDAALAALHQIEIYCSENGFELGNYAIYDYLFHESWTSSNLSEFEESSDNLNLRAIDNLMRGLLMVR